MDDDPLSDKDLDFLDRVRASDMIDNRPIYAVADTKAGREQSLRPDSENGPAKPPKGGEPKSPRESDGQRKAS